jgi:hypothetical protein
LLGFGVAAGAVALAAGAFFIGHTSTHRGTTLSPSTAANVAAATDPTAAPNPATPNKANCKGMHGVAGTLKSIDGPNKLTVTTPDNRTVTVNTDGNTKVTKITDGKVSDVGDGSVVTVKGTPGATNTVTADQIAILPKGTNAPARKLPGARMQQAGIAIGTASGNNNGTFTVTEPDGTKVTVNTSGTTKVVVAATTTIDKLEVGKPIAVKGTPNADGSVVTATNIQQNTSSVTAGEGRFGLGGGFGKGGFGHYGHGGGPDTDDSGSTTTPAPASGGSA